MKVLHIINSLNIGGAERLITDLCPLLASEGIVVDVLILRESNTSFFYDLIKKEKNKIIVQKVESLYNPIHVFKLLPIIKNYDILHVHLFPTLYWVAISALFLRRKPKMVFTEHNTHNRRRGHLFLKHVDKFIYNRYDKIISITESVQDNLTEFLKKIDSDKQKIIYNGIDLDRFLPKDKDIKDKSKEISIIQVSSFTPQKDQITLIKSLKYLPFKIKLFFVGTGPLEEKAKKLAEDLNVSHCVAFLGLRSDVPDLLQRSDIVVQSSIWEGFGLAALEGMASKKPVIASDVPGLREVVKGYGLLFEVSNPEDLAEKIKRLIADSELYKKVSESCLMRSKDYNIGKMVNSHLNLYKEIIKK